MTKQFQLVALDLDGTLFDSQSRISAVNKAAIRKASQAGIAFVISTGRPYAGLPLDTMSELGIRYAITTNGAAVYKVPEKECLLENCMPFDQTADLVDELLTLPIHMDLFLHGNAYTPIECREAIKTMNSLPDSLKEYILSTRSLISDITGLLRREQENVQKVTMNFPIDDAGTVLYRDKALNILDKYPDVYYLSGGFGNLEFTRKGISKAHGLTFLCEYLNIPLEQTLACGDSENDIDMLKAAGLGIAMENAPEHVKSAAAEITASNDQDGVAYVIEKWILPYK